MRNSKVTLNSVVNNSKVLTKIRNKTRMLTLPLLFNLPLKVLARAVI